MVRAVDRVAPIGRAAIMILPRPNLTSHRCLPAFNLTHVGALQPAYFGKLLLKPRAEAFWRYWVR